MVEVVFGGKSGVSFTFSPDGAELSASLSQVATQGKISVAMKPLLPLARSLSQSLAVSRASAELVRPAGTGSVSARDRLTKAFANHLLIDNRSHQPVGFTERVYLRFEDGVSPEEIRRTLSRQKHMRIVRKVGFAANAFVLEPNIDLGTAVFEVSLELLRHVSVSRCHPELLRPRQNRAGAPMQWHLGSRRIGGAQVDQHAHVEAAWSHSRGAGINVAIIDDGFDLTHPELKPRRVIEFDATTQTADARPRSARENHGTACAGVAVAAGVAGASGVAPEANLIAIRSDGALGSLTEADAFEFAARHGADVISCSWGPVDGHPDDPNDPLHNNVVPMSDLTRDALQHCLRTGRNGRGIVIAWAAGNGNESVDNDGYAAHPDVMAVAACNDRGTRSHYSDMGDAIACCFPSSDRGGPTPGIWTTDRRGRRGYNPGNASLGDPAGDYTSTFGGTSSACPGAAGTAALVLAADPDLTYRDVIELIKSTADRIDLAGGNYDARGHSPFYGHGRVNAERAVAQARASALA